MCPIPGFSPVAVIKQENKILDETMRIYGGQTSKLNLKTRNKRRFNTMHNN